MGGAWEEQSSKYAESLAHLVANTDWARPTYAMYSINEVGNLVRETDHALSPDCALVCVQHLLRTML